MILPALFPENVCPRQTLLPPEAVALLREMHERFTPWQEQLAGQRKDMLAEAATRPITHVRDRWQHKLEWSCNVPDWCQDQRNQMTGPADDGELVVKMLNAGTADKPMPGVMIDLEDSMCNTWEHTMQGLENAYQAHAGTLSYVDKKGATVGIKPSKTVLFTRVRGLHMQQRGVFGEPMSASVFDATMLVWRVAELAKAGKLRHPICVYIPKTELPEEGIWWEDFFTALERATGLPDGHIRCMALVESHPLAYRMEEFLYNLRRRILGLNFGRWDYIASTLHYNAHDPDWVLCDRNLVPHDAPFLQNVRSLMVKICHKRGALAIGGMTALYPSRADAALNARAIASLIKDKKNEADCGMDGAWTGHPDQNPDAVGQFPYPNQLSVIPDVDRYVDLRPSPKGLGAITFEGLVSAARTCVLYRGAVLGGKGAVLIDGYMEDLATDRIYRNMIAQRIQHGHHDWPTVDEVFHAATLKIVHSLSEGANGPDAARYWEAARITQEMVRSGTCDPN